jgi:uncharacterized SAM-binding protein YcdF (DUF218 family)
MSEFDSYTEKILQNAACNEKESIAVVTNKNRKRKRSILALTAVLLLSVLYVVLIHMVMIQAAKQKPDENASYMIILGAALWGDVMSPSLRYRLETALPYLQRNPNTKVIVSGGQGAGETMPEAVAMKRFLVEHGIAAERILEEKRSRNTAENILFSKELMSSNQAVLVTNDFHVLRARLLAKRADLQVQTLAAPTPESVKVKLFMREYVAIVKSWLLD